MVVVAAPAAVEGSVLPCVSEAPEVAGAQGARRPLLEGIFGPHYECVTATSSSTAPKYLF